MKKKLIVLTLMLLFSTFAVSELKAQSDAFFANAPEQRNGVGNYNYDENSGLTFNGFTSKDLPLSGGMLIMSATGLFYLISKNRKENK